MEFRVLGQVEILTGGRRLAAGPPQQRLVVAALALDAGRAVTTANLIDRVWDAAPDRARHTLYVLIARIRRLLERAAVGGAEPVTVMRDGSGYLLTTAPEQVDALRFRSILARAREDRLGASTRIGLLREALAAWHGEPLAGLAGHWAARVRTALIQEYLDAAVAWADAELRAGNPSAVLGPLTQLGDEHPLTESLAMVLMRALCAAGRPAEALEHYATIRRRLADHLGADPGPELQAVYQGILHGEVGDLPASPGAGGSVGPPLPGGPAAPPVPAQLPADIPGFAGRSEQLAQLDALLASAGAAGRTVTISGMAGVGKTALAIRWAHRMAQQFPDGQLYLNLRGFDPTGTPVPATDAIRILLDGLAAPAHRRAPGLDAQVALYRSLLAGRRVLLVLDNALDAEQVRPLLPGTATAYSMVTSRNQLAGLVATNGAQPMTLGLLSRPDARELLARRLGPRRVAAEPAAIEDIITLCARLPLALSIAAARARQTGFALSPLAAELGNADERLDTLDTGDPASQVRSVFSWSYAALDPPAARLFRLLSLHPGPDLSVAAAASLAGDGPAQVRRLLVELTRASLLYEPTPGRYACHELLATYADDLLRTEDPEAEREAAVARLVDHYAYTGYAADRLIRPHRDPIPLGLGAIVDAAVPARIMDQDSAMAWFSQEYRTLLAARRLATAAGRDARCWQIVWSVDSYLHKRSRWHDLVPAWRDAVLAAARLGDLAAEGCAYRRLGYVEALQRSYEEAYQHYQQALQRYESIGDPLGQARTHHDIADLWERQHDYEASLAHVRTALALSQSIGHLTAQAFALNGIGWCHTQLGDHDEALRSCEQALALFQQLRDRDGQAATWDTMGLAHHHGGRYRRAADCFHQAIALYRSLEIRYPQSIALTHLGDTHLADGEPDQARGAWEQAVEILVALNHPDVEAVGAKLASLSRSSEAAGNRPRGSGARDHELSALPDSMPHGRGRHRGPGGAPRGATAPRR